MKNLIVGNWKLYINNPTDGKKLLRAIDKALPRKFKSEIAICPQISLAPLLKSGYGGRRIAFGTQDVSWDTEGAHTGAVSPESLRQSGIRYVIVGHAERRLEGETDEMVAKKARTAIDHKLHPVICVGESVRDMEGAYFSALAKSVTASLSRIDSALASRFTIAYEPVWAIGASEAPSPRTIAESVMFVRKTIADMWGREQALKVRIIYGGAVTAESAKAIREANAAQGLLPGRASVDPKEFTDIIRAFA
jgi:triosephosphate isomerase